jgi:hypothetical protein
MEAETVRKPYPGQPVRAPRRYRWIAIAGLVAVAASAAAIYVTSRPTSRATAARSDAAVAIVRDAATVPVLPDAAIAEVAPPPAKVAPARRPAPPAQPVATGPACACKVTLATGSISRACVRKRPEPRCTCEDASHYGLCPVVKTVTDGSKERLPDGTRNGTMYCIDRTRSDCDPLQRTMPASCNLMSTVGVHDAPCRGYVTGQVEGDPQKEGHYRCTVCDWATTAPKFHGKTGDACTGFESTTGARSTGVLECP